MRGTYMKLTSINPSNNEVLGEIEITTESEIKDLVNKAHLAKQSWNDLGIDGRNTVLTKLYDLLEQNKQELAELTANEMGMPLEEALVDIDGSVEYLRWYSDHAHDSLDPEITHEDENEVSKVYREALGCSRRDYSLELPTLQLRLAMWPKPSCRQCSSSQTLRRSSTVL